MASDSGGHRDSTSPGAALGAIPRILLENDRKSPKNFVVLTSDEVEKRKALVAGLFNKRKKVST